MSDFEILKSKRGNTVVCHDGFVCTQHRMTVDKRGYGCQRWKRYRLPAGPVRFDRLRPVPVPNVKNPDRLHLWWALRWLFKEWDIHTHPPTLTLMISMTCRRSIVTFQLLAMVVRRTILSVNTIDIDVLCSLFFSERIEDVFLKGQKYSILRVLIWNNDINSLIYILKIVYFRFKCI